ncbi:ROK family protein [Deinococcus marmoris]|uniref:Glucokinase n=1 Tax=Deinococcus marmoris TaxID=249408 RepID=A0A1U7NU49_9DEIO|nr:ROK family protein [Deinococcus marmoris]OLV16427.1 glucokinase [Deinococcus marmoris]
MTFPDAVLALDIGGTHVTAASVTAGELGPQVRLAVDGRASAGEILEIWARGALLGVGQTPVSAVGISVPGPFDYAGGIARFEHKLSALKDLDIGAALRERWQGTPLDGLSISFFNDAVAFALGESTARQGQGIHRLLGLTLGTGLGSGFIVDGRPGTAEEGVPSGGEVWQLPFRGGVVEDFTSAPALRRAYQALSGEELDARQIAQLAETDNARAQQVYQDLGRDLAAALSPCVQVFRPDLIVLGGQVSRAWAHFETPLRAGLRPFKVACSSLLDEANLLGAAALYRPMLGLSPPLDAR